MEEIEEGEGGAGDIDDYEGGHGEPFEDRLIFAQGEIEKADGCLSCHEGGVLLINQRRMALSVVSKSYIKHREDILRFPQTTAIGIKDVIFMSSQSNLCTVAYGEREAECDELF